MEKARIFLKQHRYFFFGLCLLLIGVLVFIGYKMQKNRWENYDDSNIQDMSRWKTYTSSAGKFSIRYPQQWLLHESHSASNREVDNPKEINTASINGPTAEIVLQWGPMGFGGGCFDTDRTILHLKEGPISMCHTLNDQVETWSQIYPPESKPIPAFGANATSSEKKNAPVIEKIFSTLTFK